MSKLVIVESPTKAKTIQKYLGSDYEVMASKGHVRDLPKSSFGVNIAKGFVPQYLNVAGKEKMIRQLREEAAKSNFVYLATDPDREGEAIAWHLSYLLGLPEGQHNRVTFGEISKSGIEKGMAAPRAIDQNIVNSQQTRRILDRIVGYKLSPLLWSSIKRGLSAGRVQSVTVRLLVDREREIRAFVSQEYWTVDVQFGRPGEKVFLARVTGKDGVEDFSLPDQKAADAVCRDLENSEFIVTGVRKQQRRRAPDPPFITSTLQQDASRRLGFTSRRTMRAAQELYEGIEVEGVGVTGLITYMRTDSLRISDEADAAAKAYIARVYGESYRFAGQRSYKRKAASNVQDAHEAIRPTDVELTPARVKPSLTAVHYKIYKLIWERFVASRMTDQQLLVTSVDIRAGQYSLRASGHIVEFDGFARLYEAARDEKEEAAASLPPIAEGDRLESSAILPIQRFTQPPPRYTEASLIKTLEENGIGRPATYVPIISTIIDRGYVERNGRQLVPTSLGEIVTDLMIEEFSPIVDTGFSASMEKKLDQIEDGKTDWTATLDEFYQDFSAMLEKAKTDLEGRKLAVKDEESDVICDKCGRRMVIKTGRFGKFLACPGFPECKNTKRIEIETKGRCPKCGGRILEMRSKRGRIFYACENGRSCGFMTWNKPTDKLCPQCGATLFTAKGRNPGLLCEREGCGYTEKP